MSSPPTKPPSHTVWLLVLPLNGKTWFKPSIKSFLLFTLLCYVSLTLFLLKHPLVSKLGLPGSSLLFSLPCWSPLLGSVPLPDLYTDCWGLSPWSFLMLPFSLGDLIYSCGFKHCIQQFIFKKLNICLQLGILSEF